MSNNTDKDLYTNKKAHDDFYETGCTIQSIHWLALNIAQEDNGKSLEDIFWDSDMGNLVNVLNIDPKQIKSLKGYDILAALIDASKFGFLAFCGKTFCSKFEYNKKGKPIAWSSSQGHQWCFTVYAETTQDLMNAIKIKDKELFKKMILRDKTKEVSP